MELGIYHEFPVLPGRSQAECFAAGFDIVDASEEYGLDVMWLAELHFDKRRAKAGPRGEIELIEVEAPTSDYDVTQ